MKIRKRRAAMTAFIAVVAAVLAGLFAGPAAWADDVAASAGTNAGHNARGPAWPDTLAGSDWQYIGQSYGGDDIYVNTKRSHRLEGDSGVLVWQLVNRMDCADEPRGRPRDGPVPKQREDLRNQCLKLFGHASYITENRYSCATDDSQRYVATYSALTYDDYDGKGKLVSHAHRDPPEMGEIEPDMPSAIVRPWSCTNIK